MVGMDVETAAHRQIPILTMLLNNSAMRELRAAHPIASERYGTEL
jgi:thiamine pyrophosphate-dependent acetolactate synthase large subunit-like protein